MGAKKFDVLAFGMVYCDIPIFPVPRDLFSRALYEVEYAQMTTGGDALNVATTIAKLGGHAAAAGRVADDLFGHFVIQSAQENHVDMSMVRIDRSGLPTSTVFNLVEADSDRHALTTQSVNVNLTSEDLADHEIGQTSLLYFGSALNFSQMDQGEITKLFRRAHALGVSTAMDTSIANHYQNGGEALELLTDVLPHTDIFIPSLQELGWLFDGEKDVKALTRAMEPFGLKIFGVKLGSRGSFITDFQNAYFFSACEDVIPKDSTGCGDAYFGAFLFAYQKGWSIQECGRLATVVSGLNLTAVGATRGVPTFEEAMGYLRAHPIQTEIITYDEFRK